MNTYILGAGASKSYDASLSSLRMPIANDFFKIFNRSRLSEDRWVLVGDMLNVAKEDYGYDYESFVNFAVDIEEFHTHIENKLIDLSPKDKKYLLYYKAYIQLIFVFNSLINEVQNGPVSASHVNLVNALSAGDTIITFNWDTLIEKALIESGRWSLENGYGFKPVEIYRDGWEKPQNDVGDNQIKLIKLHGSSNWITTYPIPDSQNGIRLNQTTPAEAIYIYDYTKSPYPCYGGRFRGPMTRLSYYYYPPNILDNIAPPVTEGYIDMRITLKMPGMPKPTSEDIGVATMPVIIPPVKDKKYSLFGNLFDGLWDDAKESLVKAKCINIIGYSFPPTDRRSIDLFEQAMCKRNTMPQINVLDPNPERIVNALKMEFGIQNQNISVCKDCFTKSTDLKAINMA